MLYNRLSYNHEKVGKKRELYAKDFSLSRLIM